MRAYFGWQKVSRMASHYVHLAQSQIEERCGDVERGDDHGADGRGGAAPTCAEARR
jgi:hypothetical protein